MIAVYERGHFITHHDDEGRFGPTTADVEWIDTLASDNSEWVVLSGDGRILRNKAEWAALQESKLPFFCMSKP